MLILSALFLYTLKIMRNINIPSGRGIVLSGDRQKAGTYVKIAKRRMFEMKQMMKMGNLPMMKKAFYVETDCVWIRLLSIDGSDFIRIHSCAKGAEGCKFATVDPDTTIVSEFQITCPDEEAGDFPTELSFESLYSAAPSGSFNSWEDGENPSYQDASNTDTYENVYPLETGEYNAWHKHEFMVVPVTAILERKEGHGSTQALAYADFLADTWTVSGVGTPKWFVKWTGSQFSYFAGRATITYDFGAGTKYPNDSRNEAIVASAYSDYSGLPHSTGLTSSYGGSFSYGDTHGILDDMTSSIGSNGIEVTYTDTSGYAPLPDIGKLSFDFTGWQGVPGAGNVTYRNSYKTTKTISIKKANNKYTIKQKGSSVHEKI